jgi:multiple antibiotic resistance protein
MHVALFKHPVFGMALSMFFLMDSIGNVPIFIALLKNCPPHKHRLIIIRELIIALAVILLFYFIGHVFLDALGISDQSLRISGGIILFLISIRMIFPTQDSSIQPALQGDPLIVPLAVPLIAGPAILAAVMIYSAQELPMTYTLGAIGISWFFTTLILTGAPFLQKILGEKGLVALERLMGLILTLLAIQMFLDGIDGFITCHKPPLP